MVWKMGLALMFVARRVRPGGGSFSYAGADRLLLAADGGQRAGNAARKNSGMTLQSGFFWHEERFQRQQPGGASAISPLWRPHWRFWHLCQAPWGEVGPDLHHPRLGRACPVSRRAVVNLTVAWHVLLFWQ